MLIMSSLFNLLPSPPFLHCFFFFPLFIYRKRKASFGWFCKGWDFFIKIMDFYDLISQFGNMFVYLFLYKLKYGQVINLNSHIHQFFIFLNCPQRKLPMSYIDISCVWGSSAAAPYPIFWGIFSKNKRWRAVALWQCSCPKRMHRPGIFNSTSFKKRFVSRTAW